MKSSSLYFALALVCLGLWGTAQARDIVVPAGTLMTCTLDEPKFSSATVSVGDPFLCYPRTMQQFGQTVFPRGTYLVGHLEADKEPGHFVGKGYLKLAFDRIGLPASDVPLTAKVIAVGSYRVDREGKIIGHGHATRDTVEWMLPPLWPWKVLTLPARGPRPTFKGEVRVTLRVMDDITVPDSTPSGWRRFGERPSSYAVPGSQAEPQLRAITAMVAAPTASATMSNPVAIQPPSSAYVVVSNASAARVSYTPAEFTAAGRIQETPLPAVSASYPAAAVAEAALVEPSPSNAWPANVTLFALADGSVFPATQYWRDQDQLWYVSDGDKGTVALNGIDWSTTTKLNIARGVRVTLRNPPVTN